MVFSLVAMSVSPSTVIVDEIVPRSLKLEFLKFHEVLVEAMAMKLPKLELKNVTSKTANDSTIADNALKPPLLSFLDMCILPH
jgi:hypothetical protein